MNKHWKFKAAAGIGAGLLLLGAAWLAQAAITITLNDGNVCTSGTVTLDGAGAVASVTPDPGSCSVPPPASYTVTVEKAGTGSGSVSGTGFNCGADCSETYNDGTAPGVTLTATAATGSSFTGWSGGGCSTGTCVLNTSGTENFTVTATFTADPPTSGACGALPADTTVIDTGNINTNWPQTTRFPLPAAIEAFKVTVPTGVSAINTFSTARTSAGTRAKLLVVSTCPGVLEPVGGQSRCTAPNPQETTSIVLTTTPSTYRCNLTPGTYYVNAVSKSQITDTALTCSTTNNCSYFVSRQLN